LNGVSVVVSTYTEDRSGMLLEAVASLRRQTVEPQEVIVIVDHNPALLERLRIALPDVLLLENRHARGLSGTRNEALTRCQGELVAFLDDDAAARADWIARLVAPFTEPAVMAVGGGTDSVWEGGRPDWFPAEFDWVVGGSYRGQPETMAEVRNVIGNNMAFRSRLVREAGGFREDMGRVGTRPVGCEETELCIRMRQLWPDRRIVLEPAARISHHVPRRRAGLGYYLSRCFSEGISKAQVAALVGSDDATASERQHALRTLPGSVIREAAEGLRRLRPGRLLRAAAIVAGLGAAAAGFLVGSASSSAAAPGRG
jgi:GT2 family glycosyltransferase